VVGYQDLLDIAEAFEALDELERRYDDYAVYRNAWLPVQDKFLRDEARSKALRTGNQGLGKTTVGLAEDIFFALGKHPYFEVPPPPCRIAIICGTAVQSIEIQEKLWHLLPKCELESGVEFRIGKGFRGRDPKQVPFKNGSLITFYTSYQDALAVAGGTKDRVHFDEPPKSDRMFTEAVQRMFRTGGTLILTFAPVNAEVGYLRELIEGGTISGHHAKMTQAEMTPVGRTEPLVDKHGRPFTDAYIDELKKLVPAYQVPVVFDGEWEFYVVERVYDKYDADVHGLSHDAFWEHLLEAHNRCTAAGTELKLAVGLDHGDGTDKSEAACLLAVDDSGKYPRFFFMDDYVSDGATTVDMDAQAILAMLERNGQKWASLNYAIGDRPWKISDKGKRNSDMIRAIAAELGVAAASDLKPQFQQAKANNFPARGSVEAGIQFLHEAMVRPRHFYVNRDRAKHVHEGLLKWDKKPSSEHVHICDTLRYATLPWLVARPASTVISVRRGFR
jgi:hypothetical protein